MESVPFKRLETVDDFKGLIDGIDHVLLDCDGVVWLEDELIGHARLAIEYFRKHKIGVAFVSNNATATRKSYQEKFKKLGIDVHVDHVYTSGSASAFYLQQTLLPSLPEHQRHVYMIGQKALEEEMAALGLVWHGGTDPEENIPMPPQDFSDIKPKPEIGVVLASFDMHFNYKKMSKAFNYLSHNDGCVLLLSNDDVQVPLHGGSTAAGEGAIAASLKLAAKGPIVVAGKPNQPLLDTVLDKMQFERSRTLMIGDRLETDITFGNNGNIKTLLVLSGSSKEDDINRTGVRPHFVCESLGQIADMLEQAHNDMYTDQTVENVPFEKK